ncbi:MAG: HNH endonuclease signature motif containing protein, partial [Actinomycetota bacterium]
YRPRRLIDRLVRLRDATCTMPGCRRTAWRCDLDHLVRHPDGPTCPCNLHPLCRRHHRMKHQTTTLATRHPDGITTWRLPTGHLYPRPPAPALPVTTARPVRRAPDQPPTIARDLPDHDTAATGITTLHHQLHPPAPPDPGDPPY